MFLTNIHIGFKFSTHIVTVKLFKEEKIGKDER